MKKKNPTCLYSGEPLTKHWKFTEDLAEIAAGLEVKKGITIAGYKPDNWAKVFQGNYGYMGNNYFCSKSCGMYWAVNMIKGQRK